MAIISERDRIIMDTFGRMLGTLEWIRPRVTDVNDVAAIERTLAQLYIDFPEYAAREVKS